LKEQLINLTMSESHNGIYLNGIVTNLNLGLSEENMAKVVAAIVDAAIEMNANSTRDLVIIHSLLLLF
jgi:hypothetical protein